MYTTTKKPLIVYIREFVAWLHDQPVTRPLLALLYSRKAAIASALTALIIQYIPKLATVQTAVGEVSTQLVLIVLIWLFTSLGYAIEDFAVKIGPKSPVVG